MEHFKLSHSSSGPATGKSRFAVGHVFLDNPATFLYRLFHDVLPLARIEFSHWEEEAGLIPDEQLRRQALRSLGDKRFHADGGSVYAAANPAYTRRLVRLIIALQTISDYLDNLCDRCDVYDVEDFTQLHHAMRDAVRPGVRPRDYYKLRGKDDGGYLRKLVLTCQEEIGALPSYPAVARELEWFTERYCELQQYKHIEPQLREPRLRSWWSEFEAQFADIAWWEFAAATGSTLGIFALFLAATRDVSESDAKNLARGYFPWICGLHILLDYYIDLEEDKREGDFNFVSCYSSIAEAHRSLKNFAVHSLRKAKSLPNVHGTPIHHYVVLGLLGMYLSDRKARSIRLLRPARKMLWRFGPTTWAFYFACRIYRLVR